MTSPEYQAPTWVNEDDPDFVEGVSPDLGAGYLNQLAGAVEDHGQRLGAITPVVTNLQNTALDQADGDARYILQTNAVGFAPAEATTTALNALDGRVDTLEAVDLAPVATSGAYTDLTGKPAIPATPGDVGAQPAGDYATTTALTTGLAAKADSAALADVATTGQWLDINGRPDVPATFSDLTGTVPTSALPALAITDVNPVADQAAMLALTAQKGDVAVRADNGKTYALAAEPASTLSNWLELPAAGKVTSVNGQQGVVSLAKSDVGLGNVANTAPADLPVSTAAQSALDAKATTTALSTHTGDTANPHAVTKAQVGLGNVDNTADTAKPVSTAQQAAFLTKPSNPAATSAVTVTSSGTVGTAPLREIHEYTASTAGLTTPTGILGAYTTCIPGGGGGGSGRKGASATVRCGGGGGGVGIAHEVWIPAAAWGATYTVTVGAGGTGGAAVTANDTNGNAGGAGGTSTVATGSLLVRASGTNGGGGGTVSTGTGGVGGGATASATGGAASTTGAAASAPTSPAGFTPGVGAGGGGITAADVPGAGAAGSSNLYLAGTGNSTGGVVGGANPTAGATGPGGLPGGGGASGAASIAGNGQDGAAGGSYGGSGGGGGAALNGVGNSGAGGAGAPGFVRITFIYA